MGGSVGQWVGSGHITKYRINLDLIKIIKFCLKIYDLLRHPHLWVDGWVNGWAHVKSLKSNKSSDHGGRGQAPESGHLQQGYVFARVCHSVHRGVSGRHTHRQIPFLGRPPCSGTPLWADTPPPCDGHCSGRYTSYWNAFLLTLLVIILKYSENTHVFAN